MRCKRISFQDGGHGTTTERRIMTFFYCSWGISDSTLRSYAATSNTNLFDDESAGGFLPILTAGYDRHVGGVSGMVSRFRSVAFVLCVFLQMAMGASPLSAQFPQPINKPRHVVLEDEQVKLLKDLAARVKPSPERTIDKFIQGASAEFEEQLRFETKLEDIRFLRFVDQNGAVVIATRRTLSKWSLTTKQQEWQVELQYFLPASLKELVDESDIEIVHLALSRDQKYVATVDSLGGLNFCLVETGEMSKKVGPIDERRRTHLEFCAVNRYVLTADEFGHVDLVDLNKNKTVIRVRSPVEDPKRIGDPPTSLAIAPTGFPCVVGYEGRCEVFRAHMEKGATPRVQPTVVRFPENRFGVASETMTVAFDHEYKKYVGLRRNGTSFFNQVSQDLVRPTGSFLPWCRQYSVEFVDQFAWVYGGGKNLVVTSEKGLVHATLGPLEADAAAADLDLSTYQGVSADDQGIVTVYRLPRPTYVVDPRTVTAEDAFTKAVEKARAGDYADLEKLTANATTRALMASHGRREWTTWLQTLSIPSKPEPTELDWNAHLAFIDGWVDAFPKSARARLAQGAARIQWGWYARGTGFASAVTEEGYKAFAERLSLAAKSLDVARKLDGSDPTVYAYLIQAGKGLGIEKARVRKIFDRGAKAGTEFYPLYQAMAEYLLPRWFGDDDDLIEFVSDVTSELPHDEADMLYAQIAETISCYHSSPGELAVLGFDLDRVHQGVSRLVREYPTSPDYVGFACSVACELEERDVARRCFSLLPVSRFVPKHCFGQRTHGRRRKWAFGETQYPLETNCRLASQYYIRSVRYRPDGKQLVIACDGENAVQIRSSDTGDLEAVLPLTIATVDAIFSADGNAICTAGGEGLVIHWDLKRQQMVQLSDGGARQLAAAYANDEPLVAAGDEDGVVRVWDVTAPEKAPKQIKTAREVVLLRFSPDDERVLIGHTSGLVLWDLSTGDVIDQHQEAIPIVAYSMSNGVLCGAGSQPVLFRFNDQPFPGSLESAQRHVMRIVSLTLPRMETGVFGPKDPIIFRSVAISPTDSIVALGFCRENEVVQWGEKSTRITLWDTNTREKMLDLVGHTDVVSCLAFSPDGKQLASVSRDGTLRTWDMSELRQSSEAWLQGDKLRTWRRARERHSKDLAIKAKKDADRKRIEERTTKGKR